jgi:anthranilate synthase component II
MGSPGGDGKLILVLDNYDSFTFNLVHYLRELGESVEVARSDALTAAEALASGAEAFLISPGPGRPEQAGISLDLVAACAVSRRPLLGICLGLQAIAVHFGGRIARAPRPMHGKVSDISHDGSGLFAGLASPFPAARYHSLTVAEESVPAELSVNARAADGSVQGLRHRALPIHGLQFHPESVASRHGHRLLANFLSSARGLTDGGGAPPSPSGLEQIGT